MISLMSSSVRSSSSTNGPLTMEFVARVGHAVDDVHDFVDVVVGEVFVLNE